MVEFFSLSLKVSIGKIGEKGKGLMYSRYLADSTIVKDLLKHLT